MFGVERGDLHLQPIAVLSQPVGVTAGLAMLLLGQWRLRHERAQASVVGLVGELDELLLGDPEVVARRLQLLAHGAKAALDLGPGHDIEHRLGPVKRSPWIVTLVLAIAACGNGGDEGGCIEVREPEDPASRQHVVADETADYQTNPPTSGPHVAGPTPSGVLAEPVAAAIQVRLLEVGGLMIQYRADVDPEPLGRLAGADVVVAPGTDLPDPVVVTAWTWKLSCDTIDLAEIERFAAERPRDAPGFD